MTPIKEYDAKLWSWAMRHNYRSRKRGMRYA